MTFVAFLCQVKLLAITIKKTIWKLSGLPKLLWDYETPPWARCLFLEYVVKGFKRTAVISLQGLRFPITPRILKQLKQGWQDYPDRRNPAMLWAAATMSFWFPQVWGSGGTL